VEGIKVTQEQRKLIKRLGASTVVDVRTSNGCSDFAFALKVKGYDNYQFVAKKACDYINRNMSGVIDYDQIPAVLEKVV
jgi:hypothetical protein